MVLSAHPRRNGTVGRGQRLFVLESILQRASSHVGCGYSTDDYVMLAPTSSTLFFLSGVAPLQHVLFLDYGMYATILAGAGVGQRGPFRIFLRRCRSPLHRTRAAACLTKVLVMTDVSHRCFLLSFCSFFSKIIHTYIHAYIHTYTHTYNRAIISYLRPSFCMSLFIVTSMKEPFCVEPC